MQPVTLHGLEPPLRAPRSHDMGSRIAGEVVIETVFLHLPLAGAPCGGRCVATMTSSGHHRVCCLLQYETAVVISGVSG